jgi:hypothetical protein
MATKQAKSTKPVVKRATKTALKAAQRGTVAGSIRRDETLIDRRIAELEANLDTLRKAKALLTDNPSRPAETSRRPAGKTQSPRPTRNNYTVAEASSKVLENHPQLHLRELLKRLSELYDINTTEKNLNNTLNKWAKRKLLFKRVAPNTFARIESKR